METYSDYDKVVSEDQKVTIAAFFLAIAKEYPILQQHPQRVWALGKARAQIWMGSEIPEERQVGILITSAGEVYPEVTKRLCSVILNRGSETGRDLGPKWAPYLELVSNG